MGCLPLWALLGRLVAAEPGLVVQTRGGAVEGVSYGSTYRAWFGIPFAEPPVGALRWAAPVPKRSWAAAGVLPCFRPRPDCPASAANVAPDVAQESEDCLFLNIYAPAELDANASAPVIVFLHGGGYESGGISGVPYLWGDRGVGLFAKGRSDVIVVTIAYRMNAFGFLGGVELADSTGSTGNWGLQDQRLGLRWLRDNVERFGGDPSRLLLMGNSAGAASVSIHLVAPRSRGLFSRAGIDSGGFTTWATKPQNEAQAVFDKFASLLNCTKETVACLRRQTAVAIMRVAERTQGLLPFNDTWERSQWAPVIDNVELTADPAMLLERGDIDPAVPVLMGTNLDDGTEFIAATRRMTSPLGPTPHSVSADRFDKWASQNFGARTISPLRRLYSTIGESRGWWWAASRALSDYIMTCVHRRAARSFLRHQARVWRFFFTHSPLDRRAHAAQLLGACHGCEIAFIFGTAGGSIVGDSERKFSNMLGEMWVAFARDGTPAPEHTWPRFIQATNITLELNAADIKMLSNNRDEACNWWDHIRIADA